ncbi:hypothetical protein [Helicobacter sp. 10-6591]|uniref:hypothetical protein n=1 Tax=Helicobacter sp. 10-6591 TaxID=2004998 RepID=UPI000DCBC93A|nr:hypothetical protein [Helicobacter sp. 10-6591]RAX55657.1 hypothetical protein CCY97_03555 [Helicobacter sp. 10-6591]
MHYIFLPVTLHSLQTIPSCLNKNSSAEFCLCAFEVFSNILEHNFFNTKIAQHPRQTKRFSKYKILCVLSSCGYKLRFIFMPKFLPQFQSKLIPRKHYKNPTFRITRHKPYQKYYYGRGMDIVQRFCRFELTILRMQKIRIDLASRNR